ncbi:cell division protein ZapD [Striga asiatica]|uniref:Cell division protein ZapD n=1 Tax=Striga asiatica TaxID=4170 RepID=A0A5A7Q7Z0_STRAF|nr:cell division protein ZapD [Striga asiatica]
MSGTTVQIEDAGSGNCWGTTPGPSMQKKNQVLRRGRENGLSSRNLALQGCSLEARLYKVVRVQPGPRILTLPTRRPTFTKLFVCDPTTITTSCSQAAKLYSQGCPHATWLFQVAHQRPDLHKAVCARLDHNHNKLFTSILALLSRLSTCDMALHAAHQSPTFTKLSACDLATLQISPKQARFTLKVVLARPGSSRLST